MIAFLLYAHFSIYIIIIIIHLNASCSFARREQQQRLQFNARPFILKLVNSLPQIETKNNNINYKKKKNSKAHIRYTVRYSIGIERG